MSNLGESVALHQRAALTQLCSFSACSLLGVLGLCPMATQSDSSGDSLGTLRLGAGMGIPGREQPAQGAAVRGRGIT